MPLQIDLSPPKVLSFILISFRCFTFLLIVPAFAGNLLSSFIKIALGFSLAFYLFSLISMPKDISFTTTQVLLLIFKELLVGGILGFLVAMNFYAYEYAGQLMDLARGASISQMLIPQMKHQSSILGSLLFQFYLVVALSMNFHHEIFKAFAQSFEAFPVLTMKWPQYHMVFQDFFQTAKSFFLLAAKISLPIIGVTFLTDWTFGLLNKVAPQINAYFLSLPLKMVLGILVLLLCLPIILEVMKEARVYQLTFL